MKVSELIALLKDFDQDQLVVISSDAEGNNFSPLSEAGNDYQYVADSTWSGYLLDDGADEELKAEKAVVLWPIN